MGEKDNAGAASPEDRVKGLEAGIAAERDKRHAVERELSEIRGELQAMRSSRQQQQPAQKVYTRTELEGLVDSGQLGKEQADAIYEDQFRNQVKKEALEHAENALATERRKTMVLGQIDRYKEALPDVMVPGSEARNRVEQEYQYLTSLGDPADSATELKALRAVYGPIERLAAKSEISRETHQEVGGSKDMEDDGMRTDGVPKGMTAAQRAYYKPLIGKVYRSWDHVAEELKFQNEKLSKRYANP